MSVQTPDGKSEVAPDAKQPARHVAVILNPASGRGQGARRRTELEELLGRSAGDASWQIIQTTSPGGGTELAAQAAREGADVVAAAGGDGTYGEVVNGLVGTGARMGIIPLGTGNDFSRGLGLGTDLSAAVDTLFNGTPRPIDLGRCDDRWFVNVAGCGFDAVVTARVNRGFRFLRGTAAYIAAVYVSLIRFRPAAMRLTIDGEAWDVKALLCCIANSQSYGGGMRIAPDASIDDGFFDLCVLGDASRMEFVLAFPRVFKGTHITHPKVTILRAKHVRIESEYPLPVLIDGDVVTRTPAEFKLVPKAIEVMFPNDRTSH
jgi:diacylglycerol kinase (ATP)